MTVGSEGKWRPTVRVLGTGGTIASRTVVADEGAVAAVSAGELIAEAGVAGVDCVPEQLLQKGSFDFDEADLRTVAGASVAAADRADGVVVTHGTDTMEETAFLADLVHRGPAPIVFCGAQLTADAPDSDGPRNIADAIRLAADPAAAAIGVVVQLAGTAWPARHAVKLHTSDLAAFGSLVSGPLATVGGETVRVLARPRREAFLEPTLLERPLPRVELITAYVGVDGALLRAALAAGARGIVVAALGTGNVTGDLAAAVGEASAAGVPVLVSSRCAGGAVTPVYGGEGGGVELTRQGAVFAGALRPSHARVLLALGLAAGVGADEIADFVAPFI